MRAVSYCKKKKMKKAQSPKRIGYYAIIEIKVTKTKSFKACAKGIIFVSR